MKADAWEKEQKNVWGGVRFIGLMQIERGWPI